MGFEVDCPERGAARADALPAGYRRLNAATVLEARSRPPRSRGIG